LLILEEALLPEGLRPGPPGYPPTRVIAVGLCAEDVRRVIRWGTAEYPLTLVGLALGPRGSTTSSVRTKKEGKKESLCFLAPLVLRRGACLTMILIVFGYGCLLVVLFCYVKIMRVF